MVDAARQMLDELMGRNRNLHPSEAARSVSWEDPELCQFFLVKFCPHELFVNTRADLGPCDRIHDEEAKRQYEKAKFSVVKRQYEDEFLYFCNSMLNDVDRKILKGKQRLALIQKDHPPALYSRYREQLNNLNARIKKLLSEAEEAGTRGDVDQAQDLMILCEQLKDERDALMAQQQSSQEKEEKDNNSDGDEVPSTSCGPMPLSESDTNGGEKSPANDSSSNKDDDETSSNAGSKKGWIKDIGHIPEKQMEVCEVCGAFLIVGDAQQRIEDHLMGKQHLGYSKLRKAVEEIHRRRQADRTQGDDDRKRRGDERPFRGFEGERRRDREHRGRSRDHGSGRRHEGERHRHHHKSHHRRRSHSRSRSHRSSHDRHSRSRSRSRY